jgi:hypothetical protein
MEENIELEDSTVHEGEHNQTKGYNIFYEEFEKLGQETKKPTISEIWKHFLDETHNYIKIIGTIDQSKKSKLKRILSAPLRVLSEWVNTNKDFQFKTTGEIESMKALERLRYNLSKLLMETRNRKIAILLTGLLSLVAAVIAIIKLHQYYHVIPKSQGVKKRKK